jgi:hypothetical protein
MAASPLVGTFLADPIGIGGGLLVSAALRLIGFDLLTWSTKDCVSCATTPTFSMNAGIADRSPWRSWRLGASQNKIPTMSIGEIR